MPERIEFFVPGKLSNPLNGSQWSRWTRVRQRQQWREKTHAAYLAERTRQPFPLRAPKRIVMMAHTWNVMDSDGLAASLKSVRDGLMDCGLIHSDAPASGHLFVYEQRINRKRRGVQITVEAI